MKILNQYLLQRIEKIFWVALGLLLFFFLINKTIGLLIYFKFFEIKFFDLFKLLFFTLPYHIESLFSFCGMLAVIVSLSQLSKNFELSAILAQGIPAKFIFKTVFQFGMVLCLSSFIILSWIRPFFLEKSWQLKTAIVHRGEFKFLANQLNSIGDFVFYYEAEKNNIFKNLTFFNNKNPLGNKIIFAEEGQLKSSIIDNLLIFSLKNGKILSIDSKKISNNSQDYQLISFVELTYPLTIQNALQLQNISNKILQKDQNNKRHDLLTLKALLQNVKKFQKTDLTESNYYLTRSVFLFTRSLHNLALPLLCIFLGYFHPRFPNRWVYFKFLVIYFSYYILVSQLEKAALDGNISAYYSFILPLSSIILAYFLFQKKIVS